MNIKISDKHGVNPSIVNCFYCNEARDIALLGKLPGDEEAPHVLGVMDMEPCHNCVSCMEKGVILISVKDGEPDKIESQKRAFDTAKHTDGRFYIPNLYRTGGWWVMSDDFIRRTVSPESLADNLLKHRWSFIEDSTVEALGLPIGDEAEKMAYRHSSGTES